MSPWSSPLSKVPQCVGGHLDVCRSRCDGFGARARAGPVLQWQARPRSYTASRLRKAVEETQFYFQNHSPSFFSFWYNPVIPKAVCIHNVARTLKHVSPIIPLLKSIPKKSSSTQNARLWALKLLKAWMRHCKKNVERAFLLTCRGVSKWTGHTHWMKRYVALKHNAGGFCETIWESVCDTFNRKKEVHKFLY